jgi:hypothetical protein
LSNSNAAQQAINVLRLEGTLNTYKRSFLLTIEDKTRNAKYPSVTVIGIDGVEYEGEVRHIDKNNWLFFFPPLVKQTFN